MVTGRAWKAHKRHNQYVNSTRKRHNPYLN